MLTNTPMGQILYLRLVAREGFEPPATQVMSLVICQLIYLASLCYGGNGGDRTCDADIMSVVLCQLSYVTVLYLVESIGLEPIRLKSCKDFPGALPIPHIADNKKPLGFPNGIYFKTLLKSITWWSLSGSNRFFKRARLVFSQVN